MDRKTFRRIRVELKDLRQKVEDAKFRQAFFFNQEHLEKLHKAQAEYRNALSLVYRQTGARTVGCIEDAI